MNNTHGVNIYTDGGARGNPGPAALGVVIDIDGAIKKYAEFLGVKTNNEAEYEAIIFALKKAKHLLGKSKYKGSGIILHTDSELIANQLNGKYKIESESLQPLFIQVWNLRLDFGEVIFKHIRREKNKEADRLVNEALDKDNPRTLFTLNPKS